MWFSTRLHISLSWAALNQDEPGPCPVILMLLVWVVPLHTGLQVMLTRTKVENCPVATQGG